MSKVLLLYEDFAEMTNTETILKKVGFDVLSISSEFSLSQQVLSFNPDVVIANGRGAKVSTLGAGKRLREMPRWTGKVVLIFAPNSNADPLELARCRMDIVLEAPVEMPNLLQVLASMTHQNSSTLLERLNKSAGGDSKNDEIFIAGGKAGEDTWQVKGGAENDDFTRLMGGGASGAGGTKPALTDALRKQMEDAKVHVRDKVGAYAKFLQNLVPGPVKSHRRTDVTRAQKDLRKDWSEKDLQSQDEKRREFAAALFKKKD